MPRPRSNAISGRDDPRWRSDAELDLNRELNRPFVMDTVLKNFIHGIYKKSELMEGPEDLSDRLYKLYNGLKPPKGKTAPKYDKCKAFVLDVWNKVRSNPVLERGFLQGAQIRFSSLVKKVSLPDQVDYAYFSDFYYFHIQNGGAAYRIYANTRMSFVPKVVAAIRYYLTYVPHHGIMAFKVAGPIPLMNGRQDAIVIYCRNSAAAEKLAGQLIKMHGHFNSQTVPMTRPVIRGIGVSIGAEPQYQATGFAIEGKGKDDAQSFGTLRCELIAAAIHNFNANKKVFGNNFDAFLKFVAVAFRGAGLNPEKPWE